MELNAKVVLFPGKAEVYLQGAKGEDFFIMVTPAELQKLADKLKGKKEAAAAKKERKEKRAAAPMSEPGMPPADLRENELIDKESMKHYGFSFTTRSYGSLPYFNLWFHPKVPDVYLAEPKQEGQLESPAVGYLGSLDGLDKYLLKLMLSMKGTGKKLTEPELFKLLEERVAQIRKSKGEPVEPKEEPAKKEEVKPIVPKTPTKMKKDDLMAALKKHSGLLTPQLYRPQSKAKSEFDKYSNWNPGASQGTLYGSMGMARSSRSGPVLAEMLEKHFPKTTEYEVSQLKDIFRIKRL